MEKIKLSQLFLAVNVRLKKQALLNVYYKDIKIKQSTKVTYLGCILDETLSGESMAIHIINKVNSWFRFLYRQNKFFIQCPS